MNRYMDMVKKGLLMEICEYYNCNVTVHYYDGDGCYVFDNGEELWENHNIDWALFSWLDTLIDTDDELVEDGCSPIWLEEIQMIKDCVLPNIRKNN